jgi:hypothetical protein
MSFDGLHAPPPHRRSDPNSRTSAAISAAASSRSCTASASSGRCIARIVPSPNAGSVGMPRRSRWVLSVEAGRRPAPASAAGPAPLLVETPIPRVGLSSTVVGYCVAIVVVATTGLIAQSALAGRGTLAGVAPARRGRDETLAPGPPGCLLAGSRDGCSIERQCGQIEPRSGSTGSGC